MIGRLTLHRPASIEEVSQLVGNYGDAARIHAGGTDLVVQMRAAPPEDTHLIDLSRVALIDQIESRDDGSIDIGARVTMHDLLQDARVTIHFAALSDGASLVGSQQIQARATLVGNVCNASPAADTVPALHVHQAEVLITGPSGTRCVPVSEFAVAPRRTVLERGEWVTGVRLPTEPDRGSAYIKLGRTRGVDIAIVGVACLVGDNTVRLAVSSVGPTVVRTLEAERLLVNKGRFTKEAADIIAAEISPIGDVRASAWYRRKVVSVLAERSWSLAAERRADDG